MSATEALHILQARGAELSLILTGAQQLRERFLGPTVETCSIINAKSGHCAEDCAFCAQSAHHRSQVPVYPLRPSEELVAGARAAVADGCSCFGIVTSGTRIEPGSEFERLLQAIRTIRSTTGMAPSASLGILDKTMAQALAEAGCATYHHNLETARSFFPHICSTHDYEEDLETIRVAKRAGLKVCSGGIIGLGESLEQRVELAMTLRELEVDSVPL
ncbi:MAG: biotin synthase BioB, partial [Desulfuromonadaceae bacterium]